MQIIAGKKMKFIVNIYENMWNELIPLCWSKSWFSLGGIRIIFYKSWTWISKVIIQLDANWKACDRPKATLSLLKASSSWHSDTTIVVLQLLNQWGKNSHMLTKGLGREIPHPKRDWISEILSKARYPTGTRSGTTWTNSAEWPMNVGRLFSFTVHSKNSRNFNGNLYTLIPQSNLENFNLAQSKPGTN